MNLRVDGGVQSGPAMGDRRDGRSGRMGRFAAGVLLLAAAGQLQAATFTQASGSWDAPENWLGGVLPTLQDDVHINGLALIGPGVTAYSNEAYVPGNTGSDGAVEMTGAGALWTSQRTIWVGWVSAPNTVSTGRLLVEHGANINAPGIVLAGTLGTASLTVRHAGSVVNAGVLAGNRGLGGVTIEDGGRVVGGGGGAGWEIGSSGLITVSGSGSSWEMTARAHIGRGGQGVVNVGAGATVASGEVVIGGNLPWDPLGLPGRGRIVVAGAGSSWAASGNVHVGGRAPSDGTVGHARLTVEDGAMFTTSGRLEIGPTWGNAGEVTVQGAGSSLQALGSENTTFGGTATLQVLDGARVTLGSTIVTLGSPSQEASVGTVSLAGAGTRMELARQLIIGGGVQGGRGSVTLENGALLSVPELWIQPRPGGPGYEASVLRLRGGTTAASRPVLEIGHLLQLGGQLDIDGGVLRALEDRDRLLSGAQTLQVGPHGLYIDSNGRSIGLERPIAGAGGFTKQGAGTLTLVSSRSTYAGTTRVEEGTLRLAGLLAPGADRLPAGTALTVGNAADIGSAVFDLNGIDQRLGALFSAGQLMFRAVTNSSATPAWLTLDQDVDSTFAGQVTGALSLRKLGTGTLVLAGSNSYSGRTFVDAGVLQLDGSIVGDVDVAAGATLRGRGSIGGQLTVQAGGHFRPGNSPGPFMAGALVLAPGAALELEFGTVSDALTIAGDAWLDGSLTLRLLDGRLPAAGEVLTLLSVGGQLQGAFAEVLFPDLAPGFDYRLEFSDGAYALIALNDALPVPEPGSALLLLAGVALLSGRARRERRQRGAAVPA